MQDLDQRLTAQSSKIFQRFCSALDGVSPIGAAISVGAAIAPFVVYGVAQQAADSASYLAAHGPQALKEFQALEPATALQYAAKALAGELPTRAQNVFGSAMVAEATLPLLAGVGVKLAQVFVNMKRQISDLTVQNSLLGSGKPLQAFTPDNSDRPRGATRLTDDAGGANPQFAKRFDASIAAMSDKLSSSPEPAPTSRFKGPSL
jgi:hypothetical protein